MAKGQNIVHTYYQKEINGFRILVRVNPYTFEGSELTVFPDGTVESRDLQFDESIEEDLDEDGFEPGNALEFQLLRTGIKPDEE